MCLNQSKGSLMMKGSTLNFISSSNAPVATVSRWRNGIRLILPSSEKLTENATIHHLPNANRPRGRSELESLPGAQLFDEIYEAMRGGQYRLATMGIRALLERLMISKVGDLGTFERNANAFCEQGYISAFQRDQMNAILDAGHATMHRRFTPNEGDVSTALDITENILSAIYVNGEAAEMVADRVPPRPPRAKSS
jgi:hypothetical protein